MLSKKPYPSSSEYNHPRAADSFTGGHLDPRDKKKTHWELAMEIEELKKRKNRDIEEIKLIKVELHKMAVLFKKYKELMLQQGGPPPPSLAGQLPFSLAGPGEVQEVASLLSTEELLLETAKVKNVLQKEIFSRKRQLENQKVEEAPPGKGLPPSATNSRSKSAKKDPPA